MLNSPSVLFPLSPHYWIPNKFSHFHLEAGNTNTDQWRSLSWTWKWIHTWIIRRWHRFLVDLLPIFFPRNCGNEQNGYVELQKTLQQASLGRAASASILVKASEFIFWRCQAFRKAMHASPGECPRGKHARSRSTFLLHYYVHRSNASYNLLYIIEQRDYSNIVHHVALSFLKIVRRKSNLHFFLWSEGRASSGNKVKNSKGRRSSERTKEKKVSSSSAVIFCAGIVLIWWMDIIVAYINAEYTPDLTLTVPLYCIAALPLWNSGYKHIPLTWLILRWYPVVGSH
jgi:hypothetical protein